MLTILFVKPCQPPHLGYILFKSAHGHCTNPSQFTKLLTLIFDTLMWTSGAAPSCLYVLHFFFLGARCLGVYLRRWCSLSGNTKLKQAIRMYKEVQILSKLFDTVLQAVFIPTIIFCACSALIISLFACVKLHQQIPFPGIALFPLLAMDALCVMLVVKLSADVLTQSDKFLQAAKKIGRLFPKSLSGKRVTSLRRVKVSMGSTNFIEQLTVLVLLNFCTTNTVNIMLIK